MVIAEEDPLSSIQKRYAKGEISTDEYEDFFHVYRKTFLFHHVPSIKIILERYIKGNIPFNQFKKIFSDIFDDIIYYCKYEPLRILQVRYINGEINSEKFEQMVQTLYTDININDMTPLLSTSFIRYAKGEIDHNQYEKILSTLSEISSWNNGVNEGEDMDKPSLLSNINPNSPRINQFHGQQSVG